MGMGCKILLVIGAILVLVVGGIFLSFSLCPGMRTAVIERSIDTLQDIVLKDLPEGYQPDDIKAAFGDFKNAIKSGALNDKAKQAEVQAFAKELQDDVRDGKINKEELDRLLEKMKAIVGK